MNVAETHHVSIAETDLGTWDWRAELKRQKRSIGWLARQTDRSDSAVGKYATGKLTAPLDWLREVAIVLGKVVVS